MKITKRTILILFTAVMMLSTAIAAALVGVFTAPVASYAAADTPTTYYWWIVREDDGSESVDTLYISATDERADSSPRYQGEFLSDAQYESFHSSQAPWLNYAFSKVVIKGEGANRVKPLSTAYWFYGDSMGNITSIDLTGLDTSAVTDMRCMFQKCSSLTTLDLSNFNTANVTNMGSMFYGCAALDGSFGEEADAAIKIDKTKFTTANVKSMTYMFRDCSKLTSLDLSGFEIAMSDEKELMQSKVEDMLTGCTSLTKILTPASYSYPKYNDNSAENGIALPATGCGWTKLGNMVRERVYAIGSSNINQTFLSGHVYEDKGDKRVCAVCNAEEKYYWWADRVNVVDGQSQYKLYISAKDDSANPAYSVPSDYFKGELSPTEIFNNGYDAPWYSYCAYNTTSIAILSDGGNMVSPDSTAWWFRGFENVTSIDLSGLDTSRATSLTRMFMDCSRLTSLDMSGLIIFEDRFLGSVNVTDMFTGCTSLTSVKTPKTIGNNASIALPDAVCCWTEKGTSNIVTDLDDTNTNKELVNGHAFNSYRQCTNCPAVEQIYWWLEGEENNLTLHLNSVDGSGFVATDKRGSFNYNKYYYGDSGLGDTRTDFTDYYNSAFKNQITTAVVDVVKPKSTAYWFYGLSNLVSVDLSGLDTAGYTEYDFMAGMFKNCPKLTDITFGTKIGTGNVTYMSSMFEGCESLTSLDLSGFDTSKVTHIYYMFKDCSSLTSLDLSGFEIGSGTNTAAMFNGCTSLTSITAPKTIGATIALPNGGCYWAKSGDTANKVTEIAVGDENAQFINNTTHNIDPETRTCTVCGKAEQIYWWTEGEGDNLTLHISSADIGGNAANKGSFDYNKEYSTTDGLPAYTSLSDKITSVVVGSEGDTVKPVFTTCWFRDLTKVASIDLSGLDTSTVTNMSSMFYGCESLTSLNLSGFDTSKVTNMGYMFMGCTNLISLDLSGFNTSEVLDISYMFQDCEKLTSLDLSNFDTSQVIFMEQMFRYCTALESVKFKPDSGANKFITTKVSRMNYMFQDCKSLTELDLSGFDIKASANTDDMFTGCAGLNKITAPKTVGNDVSIALPAAATCYEWTKDGAKITSITAAEQGSELVNSANHTYDEWNVVTEATCSTAGSRTHTCTECGHEESEPIAIDPAAHSYGNTISEVAATATTDGVKAHKDCSLCHKHFNSNNEELSDADLVIPKTGGGSQPDKPAETEHKGLSGGAIAGISIACAVAALAAAYAVCSVLYKKGVLKGKFFAAIFFFIKK